MKFEATERMISTYRQHFGQAPECVVSAPGRVNLIGEHTDYNEGFVLPIAIDKKIGIAGSRRDDDTVRVFSLNFENWAEFSLSSLKKEDAWTDYMQGVMDELLKAGHALKGCHAVLYGNVPLGSGLSSSAALEVATAFFLSHVYGIEMPPEDMVTLCQRAENQFVGMNCGMMDQCISRVGRAGHALHLDCRDLSYHQVPLHLDGYAVAICNSHVKHSLVNSPYNERRNQCEEGVRLLQSKLDGVSALRDVTSAQLEEYKAFFPPLVYQRCKHVVTENERVLQAVEALKHGAIEQFGDLLNQSHDSLRDDYEVSCPEIDTLVEIARSIDGTMGARITGGGFGGCTVNIVKEAALERFQRRLCEEYAKRTEITADIYIVRAEDGARLETV